MQVGHNILIIKNLYFEKRNTGGLLWILMLVALLIWLLRPTAVLASTAEKPVPKRVLAIFVFKEGLPWTYNVEKGLRAALASEFDIPVELDVEHADRSRFPEEGLLEKLIELYRYKYSKRPVDLVIAMGAKAPELLLACGEDLFGDIPVVVISSNPKHLLNELTKINVTPLLWGTDFKKTVQMIQDIRPQTKNLFVVSGVSLADGNGYKRAMEALRENAAALHVESLKDLAIGNLLQKVSNLPKDSAILFTTYFRDAAGQSFIPREILSRISETANAPTFGVFDTYLGHGIVGGSLLSAEYQGKRLANIAFDLLKGQPINDAGTTVEGNLPMFDWRQLKRWGIDEKRLPPGSIVRYREPSIWEDHKRKIIGLGIIILAQAFALFFLLAQRKKRNQAEAESQKLRDDLARISRVLAMGEIAASLVHEINQPLTAIQSYAQAAERFLAKDRPDLDEVSKSLSGIVAGNRRAKKVIQNIRMAMKKEPLERAPLHVKDLIQEIIMLVKNAADEKKVVLRLDLNPGLPHVFGNRIQLEQVILNLIINGFEAMNDVGDGSRELVVRAWMIQGFVGQLQLEEDATTGTRTGGTLTADVDFDITGAELTVGYPIYNMDALMLRAYTGVRYTRHDFDALFTGTAFSGANRRKSIDESWTDVLIGLSADVPFADKWNWNIKADAGFGESEGTYLASTGVTWRFWRGFSATLFGKYVAVEFENGSKGDADWYLYDVDETTLGLTLMYNW